MFLKSYGWGCYAWNDSFVCQKSSCIAMIYIVKRIVFILFYLIFFVEMEYGML